MLRGQAVCIPLDTAPKVLGYIATCHHTEAILADVQPHKTRYTRHALMHGLNLTPGDFAPPGMIRPKGCLIITTVVAVSVVVVIAVISHDYPNLVVGPADRSRTCIITASVARRASFAQQRGDAPSIASLSEDVNPSVCVSHNEDLGFSKHITP